jgi:hypothetical protein
MIMTTDTPAEILEIRELTAAESDDAAGAMTMGTWIRRIAYQLEHAPKGPATFLGCSDDLSACSWQSN